MDKIKPVMPVPNSIQQKWDYLNKLDNKAQVASAVGGTLVDRIKLSARYRAQSEIIKHGTEAILTKGVKSDGINGVIQKIGKLDSIAQKASAGAGAVTYDGLVNHLKNGGADARVFDRRFGKSGCAGVGSDAGPSACLIGQTVEVDGGLSGFL